MVRQIFSAQLNSSRWWLEGLSDLSQSSPFLSPPTSPAALIASPAFLLSTHYRFNSYLRGPVIVYTRYEFMNTETVSILLTVITSDLGPVTGIQQVWDQC